ncbi:hypothetical protein CC1G_11674 [Coprinopsis cinerea okayama7|uniref:Tc1-like transposase DDE domain-containing protein n=1 Tax=Coprinopsis cinerea (strain Okayama-7 / 130 / ATCC MYA-4618 / FGSC 9003) TaxID=240176 RepID=A8P3T4_COPC7|nr:hypothetical protein CC1G_11674 [Coprinopsis cinerea okayama7\|eukprot:XP_001838612.1 hypothetical protein CC1G_11674 [Coprinopsis cinerea okayama7\
MKGKEKKAPLGAMPSYSGTGKTTLWKNKKKYMQAAIGTSAISGFFSRAKQLASEFKAPTPDLASGSGSALAPIDVDTDSDPEIISVDAAPSTSSIEPDTSHPGPETVVTAPMSVPDCQSQAVIEELPAPSAEPAPLPVEEPSSAETIAVRELLDISMEWEPAPARPPLRVILMKLIAAAKKHGAYSSLIKLNSVKDYLSLVYTYEMNPRIKNPRTKASLAIAARIGKGPAFARKIRELAIYIDRFHTLPPRNRGKHHAHPSLLNDERVFHAVRRYLSVTAAGEITPRELANQVNHVIIPGIGFDLDGKTISERGAIRWLIKLGYTLSNVKKGVYIDGHERPDVVKSRKTLLDRLAEDEHLRYTFDDKTLEPIPPKLGPGEKCHIPVFQDESIFRTNDLRQRVWVKTKGLNGNAPALPLRKKGAGRSQMVSDFIVELTGHLKLTNELIEAQRPLPEGQHIPEQAREIIYPGKNADGWWDAKQLIKQAIPIFEALFPNAVGEFFFDQSTAHAALAPDALRAHDMNVKPGGKQPKMHDTIIPHSNPNPALRGIVQSMVFDEDLPPSHPDYEHRGKPKGMRRVLEERGLWDILTEKNGGKEIPGTCQTCKLSQKEREKREKEAAEVMAGLDEPEEADSDDIELSSGVELTGATCCMRKVLSEQEDFLNEKPLLQVIIERAGHKCYFLPKFHCELNPIEMQWGWVKGRYRALADGSWQRAKELVPALLDSIEIKTIRAFFRKTWRYMDAYRQGLNAAQAEYAVKKYKSHRKIGKKIYKNVNMLFN